MRTDAASRWRTGAPIRDARYGWGVVVEVAAIPTGLLVVADFGLGRRALVLPDPGGAGRAMAA